TVSTETDLFLVVTLPFTAEVQSGSPGMMKFPPKNQICCHVLSVAPGGVVNVSFHTTVPWGIPPHTPQAFVPEVGWASPAGSPLDVTRYLVFVPSSIVTKTELGTNEIDALLGSDAKLSAVYDAQLAAGFTRIDDGQEIG